MSNELQLFDKTTKLVDINLTSDKPIIVHQGGTNSSKTYSILQSLYILAHHEDLAPCLITVVGQDIPNLKSGAYRDANSILYNNKYLQAELKFHNKTDRQHIFHNGSIIEFNSYDNSQDARSGKRDILFMNEANGMSYDVFEELNVRTQNKTFIDFNPTASFWAHEKLYGRDDVAWVKSNFQHNPFIPKSILSKIKGYEPTEENIAKGTANEYRWRVYGLGEVGRLEGLVFPDFEVTNEWPIKWKWRVFGLDFGFTNDPTALVEIRYVHGGLYWKEWMYEVGLTNISNDENRQPSIDGRLNKLNFPFDPKIIADSAEPKSIKELSDAGWDIEGAVKGRDSVMNGIDAIKRYPLYIHSSSKNLIEEFSSYTWEKDRNDNPTNKPIDRYNHGIDAGRYGLSKQLLHGQQEMSAGMIEW